MPTGPVPLNDQFSVRSMSSMRAPNTSPVLYAGLSINEYVPASVTILVLMSRLRLAVTPPAVLAADREVARTSLVRTDVGIDPVDQSAPLAALGLERAHEGQLEVLRSRPWRSRRTTDRLRHSETRVVPLRPGNQP